MRISDWSSDVCSSDLFAIRRLYPGNCIGHDRESVFAVRSLSGSHKEGVAVALLSYDCARAPVKTAPWRDGKIFELNIGVAIFSSNLPVLRNISSEDHEIGKEVGSECNSTW